MQKWYCDKCGKNAVAPNTIGIYAGLPGWTERLVTSVPKPLAIIEVCANCEQYTVAEFKRQLERYVPPPKES